MKIQNRQKIQAQQLEEKVKREIKIMKMCMHPHIIRLYEVIETPTELFVIIEYSSGGELFDYIVERKRLSEKEARRFFQQILSGVEYLHKHMIAHRDLKPENLLLDEHSNVKIADFGLSNCMRDGWFLKTSCGSPNYAAPEVISGKLYAGPEVDIWSCGVILYALLCGTLPFDDESIPYLFKKIKGGIYILPSYLSDLSKNLISSMLVTDPLKRISVEQIRRHPWFRTDLPRYLAVPARPGSNLQHIDEAVLARVVALTGYHRDKILRALNKGRRDHYTVSYHLIKDAQQDLDTSLVTDAQSSIDALPAQFINGDTSFPHGQGRRQQNGPSASTATTVSMNSAGNMGSPMSTEVVSSTSPHSEHGLHTSCTTASQIPQPAPERTRCVENSEYPPGAKARQWKVGVQCRKANAAEVMMELYRALHGLQWLWKTPASQSFQIRVLVQKPTLARPVRLCLQLYKTPQCYHLDIHRLDGDTIAFFAVCSELLRELRL